MKRIQLFRARHVSHFESILQKNIRLKTMFSCKEWFDYYESNIQVDKRTKDIYLEIPSSMNSNWIINTLKPILKVLKKVNNDKNPTMGSTQMNP